MDFLHHCENSVTFSMAKIEYNFHSQRIVKNSATASRFPKQSVLGRMESDGSKKSDVFRGNAVNRGHVPESDD